MRMSEHQGKSYRTGNFIQNPNSSIFDHKFSCDTQISSNDFKILDYSSSEFRLRILESLYIHKEKPNLNDMQSAMPLLIAQHWFKPILSLHWFNFIAVFSRKISNSLYLWCVYFWFLIKLKYFCIKFYFVLQLHSNFYVSVLRNLPFKNIILL